VRIDPRAWLQLPLPTKLLGAGTFAIAMIIVYVAFAGTRAKKLLATAAQPATTLDFDVTDAPRATDLAAIQSQPLVYASRSFYVAPLPNTVPAAPPRPDYRLAGTILAPHKPAVALLVSRQTGANRRVKSGDELEGWQVQAVDRKQVTLAWQSERIDLSATTTAAPLSSGLKRVPMNRARVASADRGVQSLGASGIAPGSFSANDISDQPRLYRPPPP